MTSTLTQAQIDELKSLETKATKGVWKLWTSNSWRRFRSSLGTLDKSVIEPIQQRDNHPDLLVSVYDADFLCAIRNAAPALLAMAERSLALEAENAKANARIADLEAALKPFAYEADEWAAFDANPNGLVRVSDDNDDHEFDYAKFSVKDLYRARELLGEPNG